MDFGDSIWLVCNTLGNRLHINAQRLFVLYGVVGHFNKFKAGGRFF